MKEKRTCYYLINNCIILLALLINTVVFSKTIIMKSTQCQVIGALIGGTNVEVNSGTLVKTVCHSLDTKVSCFYTDLKGTSLNEGTIFTVKFRDENFELWINEDGGNITLVVDYPHKRYNMGMTSITKLGTLVNKNCVGEIE